MARINVAPRVKCDRCGVAEDTIPDEGTKLAHVFTN